MSRLHIQYNAPVVLTFSLLSLGALLLGMATGGRSTGLLFCVYRAPLTDPLSYVRLFTHVLGHASISHFTSNMIIFLLVGPLLEEKYGSTRLLQVILAVALVTGIVHLVLPGNSALLGASGIDFAFILMASVTGDRSGIPLTMILVAIIYIGTEIYTGISSSDSISQLTHIVGGVCGMIFGFSLKGRRR